MAQVSGTLITRNYRNFSGVDFSNRGDEVALNHSPNALNVWKNYRSSNGKCIETRPDLELIKTYEDTIYGLYFYTINGITHKIVHSGTKLYKDDEIIYSNMSEHKSLYFIYNDKLYISDATNYLVYDGNNISSVTGYIPTTSISRAPLGGGVIYEDVNMLSDYRKNSFCADGTSTEYKLDVESMDDDYTPRVWVNDTELTSGFTPNYETGKVIFDTAPGEPLTPGQDNVVIQFKKHVEGYKERVLNCTLIETFDNRVFFSGNSNYPNVLFHCSLNDPSYFSDTDYYEEGSSDSKVKSLVAGNNALWVLKEPSQSNTTIFYHNPTIDSEHGKIYPSTHSSISTGCMAKGINFNDSIVFFSDKGLESITGDVTTEQVLLHRSSLVDSKLLNEEKYKEMNLIEYAGYLFTIMGNKAYLADGNTLTPINNHYEYEWFYFEFDKDISSAIVKNDILYMTSGKDIYTFTKTDTNIESYWTTIEDEFNYPQYQKTMNKKGFVVDMEGEELLVYVRTDNKDFQLIKKYKNKKGYIVSKKKKKKWKSVQIKFYSTKPFSLYSNTLEAYVGSYVKR
jgi:hypothetical protein